MTKAKRSKMCVFQTIFVANAIQVNDYVLLGCAFSGVDVYVHNSGLSLICTCVSKFWLLLVILIRCVRVWSALLLFVCFIHRH